MSVLIEMEMPKACWSCPLKLDLYGELWCAVKCEKTTKDLYEKRPSDCPLRELVRCKDCKFSSAESRYKSLRCSMYNDLHRADGWCDCGVRRPE